MTTLKNFLRAIFFFFMFKIIKVPKSVARTYIHNLDKNWETCFCRGEDRSGGLASEEVINPRFMEGGMSMERQMINKSC
jgi:hypothetical protein